MTAPAANRVRLEPHPAHGAAGADADLHAIRAREPKAATAHAMAARRDLLTRLPTPYQGEDTP
jgi:hypothetical protein